MEKRLPLAMSGYHTMPETQMWPQGVPDTTGLPNLQALEAPGEAVHRELVDPVPVSDKRTFGRDRFLVFPFK